MAREKTPATPAIRMLRARNVDFSVHHFAYEVKGGTAASARKLGVDEHCVIKTLIMEDEMKNPLIVLMHGDLQVSAKGLARVVGVKSVTPCTSETAHKHTGYQVGGISPFGVRRVMPVYMEKTILAFPRIYIDGGKQGLAVCLDPRVVVCLLKPILVQVGI
ncbi:MAG: aminoacyl-tRNA deacylase [Bacillota bacterium]